MDIPIPRTVVKIGGSWVIKLDGDTRKLLGVTKEGQVVVLSKSREKQLIEEENEIKDVSSY